MANDRVIIKCSGCGGWKMLLKHFVGAGPKTRDNGVLDWLDSHAKCHPHWKNISLEGNPGFTLHTEESLDLDWNKQNKEGVY